MPPGERDSALERVRADPWLRVVLSTARAWGVSPARFLGWEPTRSTRLERDDTGRVVRLVESVDPEWSQEWVDLALAFATWEADLCTGCRQPMTETTDPENEFLYVALPAVRCHRCTASGIASDSVRDDRQSHALHIPVELRSAVGVPGPGDDHPDGDEQQDPPGE